MVALPYQHALFGQRYFVHDIVKLVHEENVIIDKNCDVVDDIVDNIGVCGAERVEYRAAVYKSFKGRDKKAVVARVLLLGR